MCYSPEMSASLAVLGACLTYRLYTTRRNDMLWVVFLFYTLMEILQFFQYGTVNKCEDVRNKALTMVAFVFILVQPLLWNWYGYVSKSDTEFQKGVFAAGVVLSIIFILGMILQYGGYKKGDPDDVLTGPLCTHRKSSGHLYWKLPFSQFGSLSPSFFMWTAIIVGPMLFGPRGGVASTAFLAGMALSYTMSRTRDEFPSVWCLMSLPLLATGYLQIYKV